MQRKQIRPIFNRASRRFRWSQNDNIMMPMRLNRVLIHRGPRISARTWIVSSTRKAFLDKKKNMFALLFVRELKLKCESHFHLYFTLMTTQMTIDWTKLFSVDRYMYTVVHLAKNAKLRPTSMLIVRWKDLSKSRWSRRISWQPCCQMKGF